MTLQKDFIKALTGNYEVFFVTITYYF